MDYADVEGWQQQAGFIPLRLEQAPLVPAVAQFSPPTKFGTTYFDRFRQTTEIKVILNSNVQELIADAAASRIEKANVKCIGGTRYEVSARVFVIAIGALETARLLLLSHQQQPAGLGNGHDLVGRYYMDLPVLPAAKCSSPVRLQVLIFSWVTTRSMTVGFTAYLHRGPKFF
jgi:choline dehydrogenase-like flavoprotein